MVSIQSDFTMCEVSVSPASTGETWSSSTGNRIDQAGHYVIMTKSWKQPSPDVTPVASTFME